MTFLCGLRLAIIALFWLGSVIGAAFVAYGFGWNIATRNHWKMLHNAGSRASGIR